MSDRVHSPSRREFLKLQFRWRLPLQPHLVPMGSAGFRQYDGQ